MGAQPTPTPDRRTRHGIAAVAGARSHGWSLIGEVLSPPGPELVARLRGGEVVEELRLATSWLGEDAGRFLDSFMSLDVYVRRAARRSPEQDLEGGVARAVDVQVSKTLGDATLRRDETF